MTTGKVRTSETDPLQIAEISLGRGSIGLTICPGKKGPSVFGAPWDRNLRQDLEAIKAWGAVAVVTLMEEHEFELCCVPDLAYEIEAMGMDWYHLPIKDVDVPTEEFEPLWLYAGHRIRGHLAEGKKVLIHCRGGRGRTGIVAARLMIEQGHEPDDAIRHVRRVRPGAIETDAQEDYTRRQVPPPLDEAYVGRVLGCLLGGAVGDAFGYAVEFDSLDQIRSRFGEEGIREPQYTGGKLIVSDDTQMTLFTMEALTRAAKTGQIHSADCVTDTIRHSYLDWYQTQRSRSMVGPASDHTSRLMKHNVMFANRAPGNTCMSACASGAKGSPESPVNNSKGCGGVMRVAPIGLVPAWDHRIAFEIGARSAALTHGHPSGYISSGYLAAIIRGVIDGQCPSKSVDEIHQITSNWDRAGETTYAVDLARKYSTSPISLRHPDNVAKIGAGWVGEEALGVGLYAAFVASDYKEVLTIAANHDGDSDSTASIAGQIYGVWKGIGQIPNSWVRRLDVIKPALWGVTEFLEEAPNN